MSEIATENISYVKYFEPLDWVLGNGMYFRDEEDLIKLEIIDRIENTNFAGERYIFTGTWDEWEADI